MAYSQTWLESPSSNHHLFIEVVVYDVVAVANTTFYLSTTGYLTSDSLRMYQPIISNGIQITESLSLDGSAGLSFGDIEINNPNGDLDSWLDPSKYIWVNKSIKIYLGDPFWSAATTTFYTDFQLVFDGVVADIDSRANDKLNIKIRDKLERLNTPISDSKLGTYGTWASGQTNKEMIKPLVFGEVFNISPVLIDPAQLEYMFNDGISEEVIEIRDNGVPIYTYPSNTLGATVNLTTGTFKLTRGLVGTCTASIQGYKNSINLSTGALVSGTYSNNIANLIALITTQFGKSTTRLSSTTELDLTNLSAFATTNTQSVGIFLNGSENVYSVCQQLASSIGAQLFITRQGKLQLLRIGVYGTDSPTAVTITNSDIMGNSLSISQRITPVSATKLGYCYNYSVQDNLLTYIPEDNKDQFKQVNEWLIAKTTDDTVKATYSTSHEVEQKDTQLIVTSEAEAESLRLNNYYKVPRTIYRFTGYSKLLSLVLGQEVILVHNRFNLWNSGNGTSGQVFSLSPNWTNGTIDVEVII